MAAADVREDAVTFPEGALARLPTLERVVVRAVARARDGEATAYRRVARHLDLEVDEVIALARRGLALIADEEPG